LFGHTSLPNLIHLAICACAFQNAFPLLVTTIPNHMFFLHTQKTSVVWFFDFPKEPLVLGIYLKKKKPKSKSHQLLIFKQSESKNHPIPKTNSRIKESASPGLLQNPQKNRQFS
jgi:hypothetical protein